MQLLALVWGLDMCLFSLAYARAGHGLQHDEAQVEGEEGAVHASLQVMAVGRDQSGDRA